jgi:hypothetical protein
MSSRYRHRRTFSPSTAFPSPVEPGEIIVNTSNRQLAVGDAASGTLGQPKQLIAVRFFDAQAQYAAGDMVVQAGGLYRAKTTLLPGAFNASQWDQISTDASLKTYVDAGDAAVTAAFQAADASIVTNYQAADSTLTTSVNGKVAKAGDTMSGPLVLPADPTLALQASTKQYVDNKIATIPTPSSLTVSDTPPTGVPDGALWWESDSGLLYVRYNDGNTTQWVIACPQPDINAFMTAAQAVRYDTPQMLLPFQQQQGRLNINAAPFDAMAYSGLQINGAMEVNQEFSTGGPPTLSATTRYIVDGWQVATIGAQALACAQNPFAPPGFVTSLVVQTTTANASPAAGNLCAIRHCIEGYRVARLAWGTSNAQPITLSFWVYANRPGNYSGALANAAANRSYQFAFTINAAATWEYKTVTIPGDLTGTWAKDNTIGLYLHITLMAGSTYLSTANVWGAGNFYGVTGTVNGVAATSDLFAITGVIVLPGNEAPSAARSPFIMRPFPQELELCKRYYEKSYNYATAAGAAIGAGQNNIMFGPTIIASQTYAMCTVPFSVEKRALPTNAVFAGNGAPAACSIYTGSWQDAGGASSINAKTKALTFNYSNSSGIVNYVGFDYVADARL